MKLPANALVAVMQTRRKLVEATRNLPLTDEDALVKAVKRLPLKDLAVQESEALNGLYALLPNDGTRKFFDMAGIIQDLVLTGSCQFGGRTGETLPDKAAMRTFIETARKAWSKIVVFTKVESPKGQLVFRLTPHE